MFYNIPVEILLILAFDLGTIVEAINDSSSYKGKHNRSVMVAVQGPDSLVSARPSD
jgi:hypothetical protein